MFFNTCCYNCDNQGLANPAQAQVQGERRAISFMPKRCGTWISERLVIEVNLSYRVMLDDEDREELARCLAVEFEDP